MIPHLNFVQMEPLHIALYVNSYGVEVKEECCEVAETDIDGEAMKLKIQIHITINECLIGKIIQEQYY